MKQNIIVVLIAAASGLQTVNLFITQRLFSRVDLVESRLYQLATEK